MAGFASMTTQINEDKAMVIFFTNGLQAIEGNIQVNGWTKER